MTYYDNGLVFSHTDPRGMTVTNYWENLQRLTGQKYPDGTTISNLYVALDVVASKDRLTYWTYFGYNAIRQKVSETNANSVVTRHGYCACGALLSTTNAWSTSAEQVTLFSYNYQGNLVSTLYADGYSVTNWYDSLGNVAATGDSMGYNWFGYTFNNVGLLTSVTNGLGAEQRHIIYDIEDQPVYVTDANGVTITNTYDILDRLQTRTYPETGVERFGYSARGLIAYTNQLNLITRYVYDEAGCKLFETNANLEVIRYTNNAAGDLLSLTDGKNQTTRWNYDLYGRVTNKLDQASVEILRYKYDADDQLTNRWSKAKADTKYKYDALGNLTNIDYTVSPDISFKFDPLNRLTNLVDAIGTTKYTYTAGNQLLTEDGPFGSDILTNTYNARLRTRLDLQQPTGVWTNGFGYDAAKRLTAVTSLAGSFAYTYASAASRLPRKIALPNTSYITNTYDNVARLTGTYLKNNGGTVLDSAIYGYNAGNQRTAITNAANAAVNYTYDKIGQLEWADSVTNSEDRGYKYDAAWNLNYRTNNGVLATFTVDSKNQLTAAPSPVGYTTYDNNGNLILSHNEYRTYDYDDENQLVQWTAFQSKLTQFAYDGLGRLRKRVEYEWTADIEASAAQPAGEEGVSLPVPGSGSWTLLSETRYLYDGMRVIQERDGSNTPLVSYTRGNDLSLRLEGAGGIGGLLARSHGYSAGNWSTHNFYHADGNGNITYLVNSSQTLAASYRYDPFGNTISSSGSLAAANVYRFSSKEIHVNSGLYYYGYRFCDPNLQRWLNRDPVGEIGGFNLYRVVRNSPINFFDPMGFSTLGGGIGIPLIYAAQTVQNAANNALGALTHAASEALTAVGLGGKCCNKSSEGTWYVDNGQWHWLPKEKCTETFTDCDGMMCKGKFYPVSTGGNIQCGDKKPPACKPLSIPNERAPTPPPGDPYQNDPIPATPVG